MLKSFKNIAKDLDSINEMANLSKRDHNFENIKMNIRQPGRDYPHDVSVKIFKNKNDYWIIRINRNTGEIFEEIQMKTKISKKTKKDILLFVSTNYKNFVKLWDDKDLAIDDLEWELVT